jgi:anionic cell wall polymer biosynthesis LytR-Cps2A-Psr (LCP) family protein
MAVTISTIFNMPSVLKDNLIKIVVNINPEFLITLLNLSKCKKKIKTIKLLQV